MDPCIAVFIEEQNGSALTDTCFGARSRPFLLLSCTASSLEKAEMHIMPFGSIVVMV